MTDMINDLLEIAGDYASIASDGIEAGDITGHINTGSMPLNALLSGSIYGGVLIPKVTALAGEPSTGKTFYAINILKKFLEADPNGIVVYFETESALDLDMLEQRGINTKRVIVAEVATVQEFRTKAMQMLDFYIEKRKKGDKNPVLFVLDSLGGLSTQKEVEDITSGKDSRDMTRAQLIRGAFRVLTLKLGKAKIALIITNHTYDVVGCALEGTRVSTGGISTKDITEIVVGDSVETLVGMKKVTKTFEYEADEYYDITLDDGKNLQLTGEHKLMIQDGTWKKVSSLTKEDVIIAV